MDASLYEGSHRELFAAFLALVDDSEAQTAALLERVAWAEVRTLLSIGGGEGTVEATLLRHAPQAELWYLDPSPAQCAAFRHTMHAEALLDRVRDVAETTFQEYVTAQQFDRIVAMFSWFYIGTERRWLRKLLGLLRADGVACLVLPSPTSIEADMNRAFSPDPRTTLVSDQVVNALRQLDCTVEQHAYTKWLAVDDLFDGEQLSPASLAFAAFVALRPPAALTPAERARIADLLDARRTARGVPLHWDVIVVKPSARQ